MIAKNPQGRVQLLIFRPEGAVLGDFWSRTNVRLVSLGKKPKKYKVGPIFLAPKVPPNEVRLIFLAPKVPLNMVRHILLAPKKPSYIFRLDRIG